MAVLELKGVSTLFIFLSSNVRIVDGKKAIDGVV